MHDVSYSYVLETLVCHGAEDDRVRFAWHDNLCAFVQCTFRIMNYHAYVFAACSVLTLVVPFRCLSVLLTRLLSSWFCVYHVLNM